MEELFKVLVVDDDEVDRMTVRRALKSGKVRVEFHEAGNCAEAFEALKEQAFDCAVFDYCLPDGDGLSLVRKVREAGIKMALIVLTGQGDEQIAVDLMKAGASDYLSKSRVAAESLCRSVRNAIRIHRAEIEAELANQKLKESEERYRLVLQGSNDGIWDWDLEKNEIYWNDRFFEIIGVARNQFGGTLEAFYEQLHPADRPRIQEAFSAHFNTGVEYNVEFRIRHASGHYRYCTCRGKAQRNHEGYPVRIAGIISDITEGKLAEKEVLKQHRRSQLFAELTLKIRQSLQIEEILQTTVEEVRQLLQADRVLIYQIEGNGSGTVVTEAVVPGCMAIVGKKIFDPCFKEDYLQKYAGGRVRAIGDLNSSKMQPCHIKLLEKFGVKANLVVPILGSEQTRNDPSNKNPLWGLLIAHQCTKTRQWTQFEIDLLKQLADQVSVALWQAQLLEKETQQRQQLSEQNAALEQAIKELQKTQAQLIQSEKMSGLGQMVAGVAHEINNPVTFIYGNITPAQEYIEDLLNVLQLYQQYYPMPVGAIQEALEELDLDFLMTDLDKLLSSMKVGADRIRQIVMSLRNFARLDEATMKPVNIHEGLDNTLLLLQHRVEEKEGKPAIKIVKEYGNLPKVECYANQLNQVFMNILNNAIDAIEMAAGEWGLAISKNGGSHPIVYAESPLINIRTCTVDDERVEIRISDNGIGMKEEVRRRLFDPFFTTKPVGKGTGLGLAISYQIIVDKHGGNLECVSMPEKGAEFIIAIPICQHPSTLQNPGESCPVFIGR
ncbi:PAS domain-containing protein [Ancylothrix sp. C2]|uniref:ATP-binding protein n=1 Tax=Ancylothrix sp. D3o TaxID=2953691 RepID=UPI0021BB7A0A|nr:ATP-binding protein [Ancylothrix sp. D3o]MCT7950132.1 PAS domain-containing protein [Ancylothrix sp. D3o]